VDLQSLAGSALVVLTAAFHYKDGENILAVSRERRLKHAASAVRSPASIFSAAFY